MALRPAAQPGMFDGLLDGVAAAFRAPAAGPARVAGEALADGAGQRLAANVQDNQGVLVRHIQQIFNDAMLGPDTAQFQAARDAIQQYLEQPGPQRIVRVRETLARVVPGSPQFHQLHPNIPANQHIAIYQLATISDARQQQIRDLYGLIQDDQFLDHREADIRLADALLGEIIARSPGALTRITDYLVNRAGELAQNNQATLIQTIQEVGNQVLLGIDDPVREAFLAAIGELQQPFPNELDAARRARLHQLLTEVSPDRHVILYQRTAITDVRRQQIQNLVGFLGGEGQLDDQIRADLGEVDATLRDVLEGSPGLLARVGDDLGRRGLEVIEPFMRRIEQIPINIIAQLLGGVANPAQPAAPALGGGAPPAPALGGQAAQAPAVEGQPPPAPAVEGQAAQAPEGAPQQIGIAAFVPQIDRVLGQLAAGVGRAFAGEAAKTVARMLVFVCDQIIAHLQEDIQRWQNDVAQGRDIENRGRDIQNNERVIGMFNPLRGQLQAAADNGGWAELTAAIQACRNALQNQQVHLNNFQLPLGAARRERPAPIPHLLNNLDQLAAVLHIQRTPIATVVTPEMIRDEARKLETKVAAYGPIRFLCRYVLGLEEPETTYASIVNIPANTSSSEWNSLFTSRFHDLIDRSDCLFATKWVAKALYFFIRPVASFYANALISNGMSAFELWKNAPQSSTNSKEIQLIRLARKWMASLSASYDKAAATPSGQATDLREMIEKAIKSPERNKGLTSSQLYRAVSVTALDTFGPRFQWRKTLCEYYTLKIPSDSFFQFLNPVLSGVNLLFNWTTHALLFIPEWISNQILRLGTRIAVKSHPFLENNLNRTLSSFRSNTQTAHAMNKIVYNQLETVLEHLTERLAAEDADEAPIENSTTRQIELRPLVEYLMEVLGKSRYGTQNRLSNYIAGRLSLRDRAEKELDDLFLPEALEQAVSTISIVLDAVLNQESLNKVLFNCLAVANSSMDAEEPVSAEEFAGREQAIRNLSDQILEKAIFHAIEKKFDFAGEAEKKAIRQFTDKLKAQSTHAVNTIREQIGQIDLNAPPTAEGMTKLQNAATASFTFQEERLAAQTRVVEGGVHFHGETKHKLGEIGVQLNTAYNPIDISLRESVRLYEESNKFKRIEDAMLQMQNSLGTIQAVPRAAQVQELVQIQAPPQILVDQITQLISLAPLIPTYQNMSNDCNLLRQAIARAETERRTFDSRDPTSDPQFTENTATMNRFYAARDEAAVLAQRLQADVAAQIQAARARIDGNRVALQGHFAPLQGHLDAFQAWSNGVQEVPIVNLFIVDMQWVTDLTKDLACARAREKVKKMREALYQGHNLWGLVHQGSHFFLENFGTPIPGTA